VEELRQRTRDAAEAGAAEASALRLQLAEARAQVEALQGRQEAAERQVSGMLGVKGCVCALPVRGCADATAGASRA
jgi:hypothetical protein